MPVAFVLINSELGKEEELLKELRGIGKPQSEVEHEAEVLKRRAISHPKKTEE